MNGTNDACSGKSFQRVVEIGRDGDHPSAAVRAIDDRRLRRSRIAPATWQPPAHRCGRSAGTSRAEPGAAGAAERLENRMPHVARRKRPRRAARIGFPARPSTACRRTLPEATSGSSCGPDASSTPPPACTYAASASRPRLSRPRVDSSTTAAKRSSAARDPPTHARLRQPSTSYGRAAAARRRNRAAQVERVAIEIAGRR